MPKVSKCLSLGSICLEEKNPCGAFQLKGKPISFQTKRSESRRCVDLVPLWRYPLLTGHTPGGSLTPTDFCRVPWHRSFFIIALVSHSLLTFKKCIPYCVHVCAPVCHGAHVETTGQLWGFSFLLLSCGTWGLISSCRAWPASICTG